jgi:hypothetical protein
VRPHLGLVLLVSALSACSGAFDPVGTGNQGGGDETGSPDAAPSGPTVDGGGTASAAAALFESDVKGLLMTNGCFNCHIPGGASFPDFGDTYASVTAYAGPGGQLVGCTTGDSTLSKKGSHSGSQWWDNTENDTITAFIAAVAAEDPSCAAAKPARPYYDEDLGRLVE